MVRIIRKVRIIKGQIIRATLYKQPPVIYGQVKICLHVCVTKSAYVCVEDQNLI